VRYPAERERVDVAAALHHIRGRGWPMPDSIVTDGTVAACWEIGALAFPVLAWLAMHTWPAAGAAWSTYVSIDHATLAALCRADRGKVNATLAGLVRAGYVRRERRPHPRYPKAHIYRYSVAARLYATGTQGFTFIRPTALYDLIGGPDVSGHARHITTGLALTVAAMTRVKDICAYEDAVDVAEGGCGQWCDGYRNHPGAPTIPRPFTTELAAVTGMDRHTVARRMARVYPAAQRILAAAIATGPRAVDPPTPAVALVTPAPARMPWDVPAPDAPPTQPATPPRPAPVVPRPAWVPPEGATEAARHQAAADVRRAAPDVHRKREERERTLVANAIRMRVRLAALRDGAA